MEAGREEDRGDGAKLLKSGAEPIDLGSVDWNVAWQGKRAAGNSRRRDDRFWDGRAASFAKAASESEYADQMLSIMRPEAGWSVLDMGCGGGTLAIPLAARLSRVVAVDFSKEMLALVRARCVGLGIDNVTTVQGSWEDDWARIGIGTYDVAVASRSMVADDLRGSILKLSGAARRRVYIVTVVGDGPYDRRMFEAIRRPLHLGPDYIYNYNLLYQMGIHANVAFIDETRHRAYESPEEAAMGTEWMFNGLTGDEEKRLRAFLETHLVRGIDGLWRLSYEHRIVWAVIWWEKGR